MADCSGSLASETSWSYWNDQGNAGLGQLKQEQITNESVGPLAETRQTRVYNYDGQGRASRVTTTIAEYPVGGVLSQTYVQETTYDQFGRVFQQFAASLDPADAPGERFDYNDQGYLSAIHEARFPVGEGITYRAVQLMNARGQVLQATLGNGTTVDQMYYPDTGRPQQSAERVPAGGQLAVFYDYHWDQLGRLTERKDFSTTARYEFYRYDSSSRLTEFWHVDEGGHLPPTLDDEGAWTLQQHLRYDASGNILCKSDVAGVADCRGLDRYHYGGAGPHAVTQVDLAGGAYRSLAYDNNGNMISDERFVPGSPGETGLQRRFEYTSFNKARRLTQYYASGPDQHTEFHYGADRSRFLQVKREGSQIISRTHYIGTVEIEYAGTDLSQPKTRRMVAGIALEITDSSEFRTLRFQHRDHVGSIVALSTSEGVLYTQMSFDPWGQRRDPGDVRLPWVQWVAPGELASTTFATRSWAWLMLDATPRGFTGHEHLDDHGIIHMNGRIYDPHLARFLQADPFMEDTGTLNRYISAKPSIEPYITNKANARRSVKQGPDSGMNMMDLL